MATWPPRLPCSWPSRSNSIPRQLAENLRAAIAGAARRLQRWVEAVDIAGPGFINIRLKPAAKQQIVREVLAQGARFGSQPDTGQRMMVEFVSANPTGPLHVGHGRQAALGDAICNLFQTQGWEVYREFYYNDAGVQIGTLANSTQLRAKGFKPGDAEWPESRPTTATTSPTSPPTFWPKRRSTPTTASSPPAATWMTWTASACSPWPTCATSRTWT